MYTFVFKEKAKTMAELANLQLFHSLLFDRNIDTLHTRMSQLDELGVDLDQKISPIHYEEQQANPTQVLPAYLVLEELAHLNSSLYWDGVDESKESKEERLYLEELLLFIAERTTPTTELIREYSMFKFACLKPLEEWLKRYEGPALTFHRSMSAAFVEMLLGYDLLQVNVMIPTMVRPYAYYILPIEQVMVDYAFRTPSLSKESGPLVEIFRRYGSLSANMERLEQAILKEYEWVRRGGGKVTIQEARERLDELLKVN